MRGTPTRREPLQGARMDSSRAARSDPKRSAAPGSLTGEIARMLEIERDNSESANGPDGAGEQDGGQGRGLLRRARRAVTRPAGPPAAAPPAAPAVSPGGPSA